MVIDATRDIWAVHQNHGYNHHPQGAEGVWKGPEAERNERLAGGSFRLFNILDATHRLVEGRIERIEDAEHAQRERFMRPAFSKRAAWMEAAGKGLARASTAIRRRVARLREKYFHKEKA